jgi:periplasmic mercuric ion binding protein
MKENKIFRYSYLILFLSVSALVSLNAEVNFDYKTLIVSLPTIQCKKCVRNINTALDNVRGVKYYSVDLDSQKVKVTYDHAVATIYMIENAITKAGYDANNRKAKKKAYDKLDDCCKLPKDREK